MHVQVRLEERVDSLHADVRLQCVQVRHVLEGHRREANSVVVTDALIEEQTLYTEGKRVKRDLRCLRGDHIQLPELVNKVHRAVRAGDGRVDCGWQGHVDSLLVRGFNQLDHGTLEEANEAASELRPDISVQVNLNVLLRDHELNIDGLDGGQSAAIKQLLSGKADSNLQFQALEVDVSVALGLDKALLELEMTAVESG